MESGKISGDENEKSLILKRFPLKCGRCQLSTKYIRAFQVKLLEPLPINGLLHATHNNIILHFCITHNYIF